MTLFAGGVYVERCLRPPNDARRRGRRLRGWFSDAIRATPTVRALLVSIGSTVTEGVSVDALGGVMPANWIAAGFAGGPGQLPPMLTADALTAHGS